MILNYDAYKLSLKETSKDTSNACGVEFMCECENEVVYFDQFVEEFFIKCIHRKDPTPSVDALCKIDNKWCFIEFKNGVIDSKVKRNISHKIGHSLLIFLKNENLTLDDVCKDSMFILVYNDEKNTKIKKSKSKEYIQNTIFSKANKVNIRFGLEKFKDIYFKDVFTFHQEEFKSYICKHEIMFSHNSVV